MTRQQSTRLLIGILFLAVLGDALLRVGPWSLNFALWVVALGSTAWVAVPVAGPNVKAGMGRWLTVAAAFAALSIIRDSEFLLVWNIIAVLTALIVAALWASGIDLLACRLGHFATGAIHTVRNVAGGAIPLFVRELRWPELSSGRTRGRLVAPALGVALAAPVLLVFGGLFASADPVFERLTSKLFAWDYETIASHLLLAAFLGWLSAGYFRGLTQPIPRENPLDTVSGRAQFATVGIPLAAVTTLFTVFVSIQATYLFGGEDWVQRASGFGYAHYARRGFFELVAASALVVPMLLGGRWLLNDDDATGLRRFRALTVALLVLVAFVAASAMWRMLLYTSAYGLTEDRFYATAFMLWMGGVLAWFAYTIVRNRIEGFAFGVLLGGLALLGALTAMNPDGIIARVNLARAEAGHEVDVDYLRTLSADAIPAIAARWDDLNASQRAVLQSSLIERQSQRSRTSDWRTWNLSRRRAAEALQKIQLP